MEINNIYRIREDSWIYEGCLKDRKKEGEGMLFWWSG